jgi:hypothetical protein
LTVRWENGGLTPISSTSAFLPQAINNAGRIAGWIPLNNNVATWEDGSVTDLGFPGVAFDITDSDQLVGYGPLGPFGHFHAFLWSADDGITDLGAPVGTFSMAHAINSAGAGESGGRAVLWHEGAATVLPNLPGCSTGVARGINDSGDVVGESCGRATMWRILSPLEHLVRLSAMVESLRSAGIIADHQAHGLEATPRVATALLNDDKTTPARHQLNAFVEQVDALVQSGSVPASAVRDLLASANGAIAALSQ